MDCSLLVVSKLGLILSTIIAADVSGTFSPSGSVSIDCGGQQTFTCTVAANGPASWTITGLQWIAATGSNGVVTDNHNARITSTESTPSLTSTITITGFTTADNTGAVQCTDQLGAVEGSAIVVVGVPATCPNSVTATTHDDNDAVTVTWSLPPTSPPVTSITVTYCPTSSPNCGDCQVCTSPCTVRGLTPNTEYRFTVTPANNCGSRSCTSSATTAKTACICSVASASVTPAILSGVIPSVVLILINIITAVAIFLVTRHFYKKSAKGGSSSRREELYEQVEGKKMHEDINMTDSPAYGPVK